MVSAPILTSIQISNPFQEVAMLDVKANKLKRIVKRKKHLRVVNVLKEFVDATTITKRILDLKVNLTVG